LKRYIADTVAIARYFEDSLPSKADFAFSDAEEGKAEIFVPEVVVGEFIYIAMKGRLKKDKIQTQAVIRELLDEMESSSYLKPVRMSAASWNHFLDSPVSELHDRIIHSIALSFDPADSVAIITNDSSLKEVFRTIW
jgi:predicted nucleic acid-binding protein